MLPFSRHSTFSCCHINLWLASLTQIPPPPPSVPLLSCHDLTIFQPSLVFAHFENALIRANMQQETFEFWVKQIVKNCNFFFPRILFPENLLQQPHSEALGDESHMPWLAELSCETWGDFSKSNSWAVIAIGFAFLKSFFKLKFRSWYTVSINFSPSLMHRTIPKWKKRSRRRKYPHRCWALQVLMIRQESG